LDCNYEKILKVNRYFTSTIAGRIPIEEFNSDKSRIVFSSSFRRLQQKAQVFSLEPNSSVRTRLTHSIEVSDIGRTIATKITNALINRKIISNEIAPQIVAIVENACLLHDIGNPPFGHFGEAAIQKWMKDNLIKLAEEAKIEYAKFNKYANDFYEFDGNPQGLRVITRLHCERNESGLNLSYPTLLSGIKYLRTSGETPDEGLKKKVGYFQTELPRVKDIYEKMELDRNCRYPLAYIMEAADDISYCLSDISDGLEKGILNTKEFIDSFKEEWKRLYGEEEIPFDLPEGEVTYYSTEISIPISRRVIDEVVSNYLSSHDLFFTGKEIQLIKEDGMGRVLKVLKNVSRRELYRSVEAESIELSGYAIITGLLNHYGKLLALPYHEFKQLIDGEIQSKHLDVELRIFNKIGNRFITSYKAQLNEFKYEYSPEVEWWLRIHLIVDQISGMTDQFALEMYQMFEGIKIYK